MVLSHLAQLTEIIKLLGSVQNVSVDYIANRLELDPNTAVALLQELIELSLVLKLSDNRGFQLARNKMQLQLPFSVEEGNAVQKALDVVKQVGKNEIIGPFVSAIEKINNLSRQPELGDAYVIKSVSAYSPTHYLSTIEEAIATNQVLHITYQTGYSNEVNERDIEVQAVYQTKENCVVIAWCRLRDDIREFQIDRILSMSKTTKTFSSRGFDLMKYFYDQLNLEG